MGLRSRDYLQKIEILFDSAIKFDCIKTQLNLLDWPKNRQNQLLLVEGRSFATQRLQYLSYPLPVLGVVKIARNPARKSYKPIHYPNA